MHFLSEKMKSMLQSKESDQFDTWLCPTHVVVAGSGFVLNAFFQIPSFSFGEKQEEVLK